MRSTERSAPRPVSASRVVLTQLMLPTDANPWGQVHGGTIMRLVDEAGAIAAMRHAGARVVTVTVDRMSFLYPVVVGDLVTVRASVNGVGNSSLEVGVRVEAENIVSGRSTHTSSAYLVYVALDDQGRPRPVPPLLPETDDDRRRMQEAAERRARRLAERRSAPRDRHAP